MEVYDSAPETQKHMDRVKDLMGVFIDALRERANWHDRSKLEIPEKTLFDEYTPKLKDSTYGSDQYKQFLKELEPALKHHYQANSHHPEHYLNGVNDMTLVDLLEMFVDWKSASERHANGNFQRSIDINSVRFGMDKQLTTIFENTRKAFSL